MNTDQEKEMTLNFCDPLRSVHFVCVISTQPPATTRHPAETTVVTMAKSWDAAFYQCYNAFYYFLIVPQFTENIPVDSL